MAKYDRDYPVQLVPEDDDKILIASQQDGRIMALPLKKLVQKLVSDYGGVDRELDPDSPRPVQNQAIAAAIEELQEQIEAPDHEVDTESVSGKVLITKDGQSYAVPAELVQKPAAPTITAGANFNNSKAITLSAEEGATIRYAMTTDGTDPVTPTKNTGTEYSAAFNIGNTDAYQTTYKIVAVAIKNGRVSDPTAIQTYVCTRKLSKPTVGNASGGANDASRTVILSGTAGTTINYTISDGTTTMTGSVSASESQANRTLTLSRKGTWSVTAYASQTGWANSDNASKTDIVVKKIATPTVGVSATDYDSSRTVTLACATDGASIFYRFATSGEWIAYSAPFPIDATKTVYVRATKTDWTTSEIGSQSVPVGTVHTHYGMSARISADSTTLAAMANEIKAASPAGTYTFDNSQGSAAAYMWIFIPSNETITHMYNAADFDMLSAFNVSSQAVTINGKSYKWYRSINPLPVGESTTLRITA